MHTARRRDIVVVDTNVVGYMWRRRIPHIVEFYDERLSGTGLRISFMTAKEMHLGMLRSTWNETTIESWRADFQRYTVIHTSDRLFRTAAFLQDLCGSQRPSEADLWIAATALMLDCRLATEDGNLVEQVKDHVDIMSTHAP